MNLLIHFFVLILHYKYEDENVAVGMQLNLITYLVDARNKTYKTMVNYSLGTA
ncbi:hypothetical protein YC2023_104561 [Brassica napus]